MSSDPDGRDLPVGYAKCECGHERREHHHAFPVCLKRPCPCTKFIAATTKPPEGT